jgi:nucleotide-binding universal stress UspA family protein
MISSFSEAGTSDGGNIVVGWDRTPAARAALLEAVDLAEHLHAHLHIAHIADDSDLGIDPDSPTWEAQTRARSDATAQWVRSLLAGVGTGWTYYSARGSAANVLDRVAKLCDARLVVIGAHRHGVAGLLSRVTRPPLLVSLLDDGWRVVVVPATSGSR